MAYRHADAHRTLVWGRTTRARPSHAPGQAMVSRHLPASTPPSRHSYAAQTVEKGGRGDAARWRRRRWRTGVQTHTARSYGVVPPVPGHRAPPYKPWCRATTPHRPPPHSTPHIRGLDCGTRGRGRRGAVEPAHGLPVGRRWPGTGDTIPHERAVCICTPNRHLHRRYLAATVRGPMCRV